MVRHLSQDGYAVSIALSSQEALSAAADSPPDLVILHLGLPDLDAVGVVQQLREQGDVPLIMVSPTSQERDRIFWLNVGADDVLPPPFSPVELAARVRSVLRRTKAPAASHSEDRDSGGAVSVDVSDHTAHVLGRGVTLTALEARLLQFFVRHPDEALTRQRLLEEVWGFTFGDTTTVTVHVRRIREKIEPDPATPCFIKTVWGVGYLYDPAGGGGRSPLHLRKG
ncbi:MAG: response regulator transcription factor [Euzebyales bacterium]|nr:response regulator transcription factor [Euzebyales bacterium]